MRLKEVSSSNKDINIITSKVKILELFQNIKFIILVILQKYSQKIIKITENHEANKELVRKERILKAQEEVFQYCSYSRRWIDN